MKKIEITVKQAQQFNQMKRILNRIAKTYLKPHQLKKESNKEWGLNFEEAIEMAYENIQNYASIAIKGVKEIVVD